MNRKEREKLLRRQEIIDAAVKIFAKKGYKATTLDEIAVESEFGKGTIYNYFSSKEELYKEIITSILKRNKKAVTQADKQTNSLSEFLFTVIKQHINFCINNREAFLLLIFTEFHHPKSTSTEISKIMDDNHKLMTEFFVSKAKTAIDNKEIRELDPEKTIRLFRGIGFNYIYDLLLSGNLNENSVEKEAKFITDILFNGIKY